MISRGRRARSERGATLVLVALSLVVLLGMGALAVDLAAAFSWRAEAQKIADSAALAGGSAFLDVAPGLAEPIARSRAYEYALRHTIKSQPVDSAEVQVFVITDSMKVRVWVGRDGMPTWFARVLGIDDVDIAAVAAAQAVDAGAARCVKPIALPDAWDEVTEDTNGNRLQDPGEEWTYDPAVDGYGKLQSWDTPAQGTGYGTSWRNERSYTSEPAVSYDRDFGRTIQLKSADPNDPYNFSPGIFFPWRLPVDPDQETCESGGGGGQDSGGAVYRNNICTCNNNLIEIGVDYDLEPGNMIGPTFQGIRELIAADPNIYWINGRGPVRDEPGVGTVDVVNSPRIIKIALFQPDEIQGSGMQSIKFNNFALMFLEEQGNSQDPVVARFMYWPTGEESNGPETGTLVRYLRLVE